MFKDARALDYQRTAASFDQALKNYQTVGEKWFDGSVGSIDRRLGSCDRLLNSVRATVARVPASQANRYLHAAEGLDSDRRTLQGLREDLLTGASHREDVSRSPGGRTANKTSTPHGGISNLRGSERRWVELEAAKFVAANQDTLDDISELSTRAASYSDLKTSTLTPEYSRAITRAFVGKVEELGSQTYVPTTVRTAAVDVSFDAEAMFL
jgi:hypothetical protein